MRGYKTPVMKRAVGILSADKISNMIRFYSSERIAAIVDSYGTVKEDYIPMENCYVLYVDSRYDFDDILEWLKSID